ncbi:MAG: hypothetical protein E7497_02260 [Ruminococcus sp.]|nr:hypothetical protein [Ruminococcus sp.]
MIDNVKCTLLSLIFAAVSVIQAMFNPVYRLLESVIGHYNIDWGIFSYLTYGVHSIYMWVLAAVFAVLGVASALLLCNSKEKSDKNVVLSGKVLIASITVAIIAGAISVVTLLISIFIFLRSGIIMSVPVIIMCFIAIIFSVKINLESGVFYGF